MRYGFCNQCLYFFGRMLKKQKEQHIAAARQLENTKLQIGIMQEKIEALKPQVSVASGQVQDILAKVN